MQILRDPHEAETMASAMSRAGQYIDRPCICRMEQRVLSK